MSLRNRSDSMASSNHHNATKTQLQRKRVYHGGIYSSQIQGCGLNSLEFKSDAWGLS